MPRVERDSSGVWRDTLDPSRSPARQTADVAEIVYESSLPDSPPRSPVAVPVANFFAMDRSTSPPPPPPAPRAQRTRPRSAPDSREIVLLRGPEGETAWMRHDGDRPRIMHILPEGQVRNMPDGSWDGWDDIMTDDETRTPLRGRRVMRQAVHIRNTLPLMWRDPPRQPVFEEAPPIPDPVPKALNHTQELVCQIIDFFERKDIPESDKAPREFLCPLSLHAMRDPVRCSDGHVYERVHIDAWRLRHPGPAPSPLTRQPLSTEQIHLLDMRHSMRNWVKQNITLHEGWDLFRCMQAFLGYDIDDESVRRYNIRNENLDDKGRPLHVHLDDEADAAIREEFGLPNPVAPTPAATQVSEPVATTDTATQTPAGPPTNRRDADLNRLIQQLLEHRVQYAADLFQDRLGQNRQDRRTEVAAAVRRVARHTQIAIVAAQVGTAFTNSRIHAELESNGNDMVLAIRHLRNEVLADYRLRPLLPELHTVEGLPRNMLPPWREGATWEQQAAGLIYWIDGVRVRPP